MSLEHELTRREAFLAAAAGGIGLAGHSFLNTVAAAPAKGVRPRQCIVLWLHGGPSQLETFDMKPDAPDAIRGEFKSIRTSVPGADICEYLPNLAKSMHEFALLRTMSTGKGPPQHSHAHNFIRYGRVENVRDPVADRPTWGPIVSAGRKHEPTGLPNYVVIGPPPDGNASHIKSGYLGHSHAAMSIADPSTGLANLSARFQPASAADRLSLLAEADREFAERRPAPAVDAHRANVEATLKLMRSPAAAAFDLSKEPAKLREAYGNHHAGRGCLLARRLIEVGVPFVEVIYPNKITANGDWDTHKNNFPTLKNILLPSLDAALPTLIADLKQRGLLETTLVIAMGEMGRTWKINSGASRDHQVVLFPALFAGAGIKAGQVIGATSKDGTEVKDRPVNAAELLATICRILHVEGETEYDVFSGKPIDDSTAMLPPVARATLFNTKAKPVHELMS